MGTRLRMTDASSHCAGSVEQEVALACVEPAAKQHLRGQLRSYICCAEAALCWFTVAQICRELAPWQKCSCSGQLADAALSCTKLSKVRSCFTSGGLQCCWRCPLLKAGHSDRPTGNGARRHRSLRPREAIRRLLISRLRASAGSADRSRSYNFKIWQRNQQLSASRACNSAVSNTAVQPKQGRATRSHQVSLSAVQQLDALVNAWFPEVLKKHSWL